LFSLLAGILALPAVSLYAQDSGALIDALVRKGILTDQEAEEIRADLTKEFANTSAGKIQIGSWVKELRIYGDGRLRYQYDNAQRQIASVNHDDQRSRWRWRLRLYADFKLAGDIFGGFSLQTGQASDTANQTMDNGFDDWGVFIARAFLGWQPTDSLTLTVGKIGNPFYTTQMIWEPDVQPAGLFERFDFHKAFGWEAGGEPVAGYAKEGKAPTPPPPSAPFYPIELSFIAGQMILDDNNEYGGVVGTTPEIRTNDTDASTDAYMFFQQLVAKFNFSKSVSLTVAPGFYTENAARLSGLLKTVRFSDTAGYTEGDAINRYLGETRDLNVLLFPGDFQFKLGGFPIKIFWDFAYNVTGDKRFEEILSFADQFPLVGNDGLPANAGFDDKVAWNAGIQIGNPKKKGDWSILAAYRRVGIAATDPNISDSNFAQGFLNSQGIQTSLVYLFTDFVWLDVTAYCSWNLNDDLQGGAATGVTVDGDTIVPAIARDNSDKVIQVNLLYKF
jgi:hypothetical protein